MSTLYVMVGIPGSGKSTWAKAHLTDAEYISRDNVRLSIIKDNEDLFSHEDEVYDKFVAILADGLRNQHNMVADATHMSHGARKKLINAIAKNGVKSEEYEIVFVYMNTPIEECIRRDDLREGRAHVTAPVIRRMARSLSCPAADEFPNIKEVIQVRE